MKWLIKFFRLKKEVEELRIILGLISEGKHCYSYKEKSMCPYYIQKTGYVGHCSLYCRQNIGYFKVCNKKIKISDFKPLSLSNGANYHHKYLN